VVLGFEGELRRVADDAEDLVVVLGLSVGHGLMRDIGHDQQQLVQACRAVGLLLLSCIDRRAQLFQLREQCLLLVALQLRDGLTFALLFGPQIVGSRLRITAARIQFEDLVDLSAGAATSQRCLHALGIFADESEVEHQLVRCAG
jgi:hypothetical protein